MLRVGPWNRLALTIQWLSPKYAVQFEPSLLPPPHMPIAYGKVISKKVAPPQQDGGALSSPSSTSTRTCDICYEELVPSEVLHCMEPHCRLEAHIICLARHFLRSDPDRTLPLEGSCPLCHKQYLWADVIRKSKGCYQEENLTLDETTIS